MGLARNNTARLGLENVRIASPEMAKAGVFAAIYSNPPVRVGKDRMRTLLLEWLAHPAPAGRAYWVVMDQAFNRPSAASYGTLYNTFSHRTQSAQRSTGCS